VLFVVTLYCGPKTRSGKGRGSNGSGLYLELAPFGFSTGVSPALVSTVARLSVLMPSFEHAHREMNRRGVSLNLKTVRRITERLGMEMLTTRKRDLMAWRAGELQAGDELAGKRIGVAIDGGRTRLRENRRRQKHYKRRGKRIKRRRRYKACWREPKLLIIFELDKRGRMKRTTRAWIDGTFQGPNHLMELLAFHLHRLGAASATSVAFLSDGAPWIWDRLAWVQQKVGLAEKQTHRILDWCHATHHVSLALEHLQLSDAVRNEMFPRLRKQMRGGRVDRVIDELSQRAAGKRPDNLVWREITYLRKHAPHMAYKKLRDAGLPMGSGAIESAIRRVVNQRLKGNGITWLKENAEAMLVLRAAALTDRWEESLEHVRATMATSRRIDWPWPSPDMPIELHERPAQVKPPEPPAPQPLQTLKNKEETAMAA
jgi:hypothetical protein